MKGVSITTVLLAVSVLLGFIILAIGANFGTSLDEKSRVETLPLVDKRVESTILMASGVEEGTVQMNFEAAYGLSVREDGTRILNYTSEANIPGSPSKDSTELNSPVDFSISEEGSSNKFCIKKRSTITIAAEAC